MSPLKLVATVVALALVAILALQFLRALPEATRRDRTSTACLALSPTEHPHGSLPRPAPDLIFVDHTGATRSLAAYRGEVVFVNFWASWCAPCVEEMPALTALQRAFASRPFTVLAVASSPDWPPVRSFFGRGTPLTVGLDKAPEEGVVGPAMKGWGTTKLPESYLIDKQGNIRYYYVNKRNWASPAARECVRSLLDE